MIDVDRLKELQRLATGGEISCLSEIAKTWIHKENGFQGVRYTVANGDLMKELWNTRGELISWVERAKPLLGRIDAQGMVNSGTADVWSVYFDQGDFDEAAKLLGELGEEEPKQ